MTNVDEEWVLDLGLPSAPPRSGLTDAERARRSIASMVDEALASGAASSLNDLLAQVAAFRQYRPFNALLAVLQHPHPQHLLPADDWRERWGRSVRPHERPTVLLVPHGPVMFQYDVSQTEGDVSSRALPPHLRNPFAMRDVRDADFALSWLKMNAKHDGVRVLEGRTGHVLAGTLQRSAAGQTMRTDSRDGQVVGASSRVRYECMLNSAYTATEQLATLAHELGHLYCGHQGAGPKDWWKDRSSTSHMQKEFEAETTAQVVFRRIAPDAELPPHLDQYCRPGAPRPGGDWSVIMRAAARVIDMCQGDSPKRK